MIFDLSSIRAISFDGDETLWDFRTAMRRALDDAVALLDGRGLAHEAGRVTADWLAALRDEVAREPGFSGATMEEIRLESFVRAVRSCGSDDPSLVTEVYDRYMATRFGAMALYPETADVLEELHTSYPCVLVTNGNSDPERLGVGGYFTHRVVAAECGLRKPDPRIYSHTAELLGLPTESVLHVGDHPEEDVAAAARAGMRTVHVNRTGSPPPPGLRADAEVTALTGLVELLRR
ncbi:HAD family hydrolase [Nocardiopsis dassonvillei]|uniref:HAD family hydrolase n=1 Tax=Nocardiopsis dassonvillei TaxID=2014 RepID=UPI00200CFC2F|nr:HAD family hydrolase [Nocardiopsis dassonvillei]MCK9868627.1 HAD family hydrolase [Nocardiopsis dassonvillei]